MARIALPELSSYFFRNLKNPLWLQPLREKGYFTEPPKPIEVDGGWMSPPWPQLDYLEQVSEASPAQVASIIDSLETENWTVQFGLIEVALKLPPADAKKLVPKLTKWTKGRFTHPLTFDKLAKLSASLGNAGEVDVAIVLAGTLLRLERPDRKEDELISVQVKACVDEWHYGELLNTLAPALGQREEYRSLLSTLLRKALEFGSPRFRKSQSGSSVDDLSNWWRPAIEDHAQNGRGDIRDSLVEAIRNDYASGLGSDTTSIETAWRTLLGQKLAIFHRIALYLLGETKEPPQELVREAVLTHGWSTSTVVHHEFFHLLENHFGKIDTADQATYLDSIREKLKESDEPERADWREYRLLYPLKDHVAGLWKSRFDALHARLGDLDHPDFLSYHTTGFGWEQRSSPKSVAELTAMPTADLVQFLVNWKPEVADSQSPTLVGLAGDLTETVKESARRFASDAPAFIDLSVRLSEAYVDGLNAALKNVTAIDWEPLLKYMNALASHHATNEEADYLLRRVLALVSIGLFTGDQEIPVLHRNLAWEVVGRLCEHSDPRVDPLLTDDEGRMGLANEAINTVRGEAMHTAIRYGLWVRRGSDPGVNPQAADLGLAYMPELQAVLDAHLDLSREDSLAIRSVYGQWLPWLHLLDTHWLTENLPSIFPVDKEHRAYFQAAWDTYLLYCPAYSGMFDVLRTQYIAGIRGLPDLPAIRPKTSQQPVDHLAEHLASYYWRGLDGLADDSLVTQFFVYAPEWLKERFVEFIGRSIRNAEEEIPADVATRLMDFWDWRLQRMSHQGVAEANRGELEGFAWWVGERRLDAAWTASKLSQVSLMLPSAGFDFMFALDGMLQLSQGYPVEIATTIDNLVTKDKMGWNTSSWTDKIAEIMRVIVATANEKAIAIVKHAADNLGRKNFMQFREFAAK